MLTGLIPTLIELNDVTGSPKIRKDLPAMSIGSRVVLAFKLQRRNGKRTEELKVDTEFKVLSVFTDAKGRQNICVQATKVSPAWRAIKNPSEETRKLAPTRFPRTPVG